jgi:inner membrane protein
LSPKRWKVEQGKRQMLVFGHAGITLAAALLLNSAPAKNRMLATSVNRSGGQAEASAGTSPTQKRSSGRMSWLTSLADRIDIRILFVGSLLPDIIDKPVGLFFFKEIFSNGRIFCHTLLFLVLITIGGLLLYLKRSKTWLLVLSFGTFTHLILDMMWRTPQTLLWPLYGFSFAKVEFNFTPWLLEMFYAVLNDPTVFIPELVGVGVVIWFVWVLWRREKIGVFLRNGRV